MRENLEKQCFYNMSNNFICHLRYKKTQGTFIEVNYGFKYKN